MQICIIGAGAGGGLPQWNCGCPLCAAARAGEIPSMTQSSIALSADGEDWVLVNASPDIRVQLAASPMLHPRSLRGSPVKAVVLTNADLDHIAGLLTLREKTGFMVFATQAILDVIASNSVFAVLDPALVRFVPIRLDIPFTPVPGVEITPYAVPGKIALFLESDDLDLAAMGEQTIALRIATGARVAHYIPGCATVPDWLIDKLSDADLLFFDGTVYQNDDMARSGTGAKTGSRMGHIAMAGPEGSLARLSHLPARKVYTHINNTNPVLMPGSPERAAITAAGWSIAQDGQEYHL